jgi:hypothetical protein
MWSARAVSFRAFRVELEDAARTAGVDSRSNVSVMPAPRARSIAPPALLALLVSTSLQALPTLEPDVARRLGELDCSRVGAADVISTLARAPAPRIIALQGSVPIVTMEPFAEFLQAMGYPAAQLDQPGSPTRSYSSFVDSRRLAGHLAWHYEREGMMPMLIGHSQGGMIVVKLLHELAATQDSSPIPVWNPLRDAPESRTTIVDPLTGESRPVKGLQVQYATALVTGSLPRLLLGQWGILPLLRDVPDSVVDFTGFAIPWDPIAGTAAKPAPYRATGTARVRNIVLPASYSHIALPRTGHLAAQPSTRAWIDAYHPGTPTPIPEDADTSNLLHAADIWYSVKQHWCEGAKRMATRAGSLR